MGSVRVKKKEGSWQMNSQRKGDRRQVTHSGRKQQRSQQPADIEHHIAVYKCIFFNHLVFVYCVNPREGGGGRRGEQREVQK